jgi:hypothetical protein
MSQVPAASILRSSTRKRTAREAAIVYQTTRRQTDTHSFGTDWKK